MQIVLGSGKNRQKVEIPHISVRSKEEQERISQDAIQIKFPKHRDKDD